MSTDILLRALRRLLPIGLTLAAGCSGSPPATPSGASILHGHLSLGPHSENFLPCGADRPLRLLAAPPLAERLQAQYLSLAGEPYEEVFLRVRGRHVSGNGDRLQVEQILDLRAAAPGDCH